MVDTSSYRVVASTCIPSCSAFCTTPSSQRWPINSPGQQASASTSSLLDIYSFRFNRATKALKWKLWANGPVTKKPKKTSSSDSSEDSSEEEKAQGPPAKKLVYLPRGPVCLGILEMLQPKHQSCGSEESSDKGRLGGCLGLRA
nr:nucleolar and coiled-body phosphoprotein 1-like [Vulpes vulpes]